MGELALAIVARVLFQADALVEGRVATVRRELDTAQSLGNVLLRTPLPLYNLVPYLPVFRRIPRAASRLRALVQTILDQRREQRPPCADLLDDLMAARDDESFATMDDRQLLDEVLTLLLAGHETTLLGLSWCFYLLARYPRWQQRAREEAMACSSLSDLDMAGVERLSFTRACALEALRLYPPAYIIGREARVPDQIGEFVVPQGMNVLVNIYGLHRHPDFWEQPEAFHPPRMETYDLRGNPFGYLPFGAGPRRCIGYRFTMLEMTTILAHVLKRFRFTLVNTRPVRPSPQITLKPSRPISLRLEAIR